MATALSQPSPELPAATIKNMLEAARQDNEAIEDFRFSVKIGRVVMVGAMPMTLQAMFEEYDEAYPNVVIAKYLGRPLTESEYPVVYSQAFLAIRLQEKIKKRIEQGRVEGWIRGKVGKKFVPDAD